MSQPISDTYERVPITSRAQWRAWLAEHHQDEPGAWAITFKKASKAGPYVAYEELVLECLCFGWIDTKGRRLDDDRTQLLCTPRRPKGNWSASNKARIEVLEAEGLIEPPGRAVIDAAKANGSWTASK
jgi:uncharacterized protein YdeI (YjbR/CyaY-like superfamily)